MAWKIKTLRDWFGNQIIPRTRTVAVFDNLNRSLQSFLDNMILAEDVPIDPGAPPILNADTLNNQPASYYVTKTDICLPNLADNGHFGINQRKLLAYNTPWAIALDRWHITNEGGGITIDANNIITLPSREVIYQIFEGTVVHNIIGKVLTLSVKLQDDSVISGSVVYPTVGVETVVFAGGGLSGFFRHNSESPHFAIQNDGTTSKQIKAIKLEIGNTSTLSQDIPRALQNELNVCQRYYEQGMLTVDVDLTGSVIGFFPYKTTKRLEKPTVQVYSVNNVAGKVSYWDGQAWIDVDAPIITDWNTSYGFAVSFINVPAVVKRNIRFSFSASCEL